MQDRHRVFHCFHSVESVSDGYTWIKYKLEENESVKWYRAQLEKTEKDGIHVQAVWGYLNAKTLGSVQKFFQEPSIQVTENPDGQIFYCTDYKKRIEGTELMMKGEFKVRTNQEALAKNLDIAEQMGDFGKAMRWMKEHHKVYFIANRKKLAAHFREEFSMKDQVKYSLDQFTAEPIDKETLAHRAVLLVGDSSYGKTSFALAHFKNPVVIRSRLDYQKITDETDGVVFDDMDMNMWSLASIKALIDVDGLSFQDVKYGSVSLRVGLPRFICVNNQRMFWPRFLFNDEGKRDEDGSTDFNAILKRIKVIKVLKPLFDKSIEDCQAEYDAANCDFGLDGNLNTLTLKKKFNANDYIRYSPY